MMRKRLKRICQAARDRPVYIKAGIAAVLSLLCFGVLCLRDGSQTDLAKNEAGQTVIERGGAGEDTVRELHVKAGEMEEEVEIRISGQTYSEEELKDVFARAEESLPDLILNGNSSTDEVRTALCLITEVPGTGLRVSWEMDRYDVIDLQGNIIAEELPAEGIVVHLKAILTYEGSQQTCEFGVRVLPPVYGEKERLLRAIREEAGKADEETRDEEYMILPDRAGGEKLQWTKEADPRAFGILVLGLGASGTDELAKSGGSDIAMTHDQIARYMGSAREVVSRMLKYFAQEGLVKLWRGGLTVLDKPRLQRLARGEAGPRSRKRG